MGEDQGEGEEGSKKNRGDKLSTNGCLEKSESLFRNSKKTGFYEIRGGGKGAHRKFAHVNYAGAVTLSGQAGDDAKPYQEQQVKQAVGQVKR